MWRLLPILIGLGFLELLVPWPDVAALVLSNPRQMELHDVANGGFVHGGAEHLRIPGHVSRAAPAPTLARIAESPILSARAPAETQ